MMETPSALCPHFIDFDGAIEIKGKHIVIWFEFQLIVKNTVFKMAIFPWSPTWLSLIKHLLRFPTLSPSIHCSNKSWFGKLIPQFSIWPTFL